MIQEDTISAVITAPGNAAVGIVRISGTDALTIADTMFFAASGKKLEAYPSHTMVYGFVKDEKGAAIDEVLAGAPFLYGGRRGGDSVSWRHAEFTAYPAADIFVWRKGC